MVILALRRAASLGVIPLFIISSFGCGGSGARLYSEGISGPDTLSGRDTAEYSVSKIGIPDISYQWICNPLHAGDFNPLHSPTTEFTARDFNEETPVTIQVVVNHKGRGPIVYRKDITITRRGTKGWARTWGRSSAGWSDAIAVDDLGNIYTTGYFTGTVDFDPGPDVYEQVGGNGSVYLSKLNPNGEFQWVRTWLVGWGGVGIAVSVNSLGDVYVIGLFDETSDFDPGPGTDFHSPVTLLSGYAGLSTFLSRFDSSGEFIWARTWGGNIRHNIFAGSHGLALDNYGDIYVTGGFKGTADFDPGPGIDEHTSHMAESISHEAILGRYTEDAYLTKLNHVGEFQWARSWGGITPGFLSSRGTTGHAVEASNSGDVYVTGRFYDLVDFDPGPGVQRYSTVPRSGSDAFLSVFDSHGGFQQAMTWGGSRGDSGTDLTLDDMDNLYITGHTFGPVDFDPGEGMDEQGPLGYNSFLVKYDPSNTYQWSGVWGLPESGGSYGEAFAYGVTSINSGEVYVTGSFIMDVDFDTGPDKDIHTSTTEEGPSYYSSDIFLSKFDSTGNFLWARTWGGELDDRGLALDTDPSSNIFVFGMFTGNVDFDPGEGTDFHKLPAEYFEGSFLSRFPPDGDW